MSLSTQIANEQETSCTHDTSSGVVSHTIELRCFVYEAGENLYRAECIDLDITAEASTVHESKKGLEDAMYGYLNVICDGKGFVVKDEKTIRKQIFRPSPWSHRLRYHIARLLLALAPKSKEEKCERFYNFPAPSAC